MSSWELISLYYPWFAPMFVAIIGLCVGSFLNVCIYRMPRGLSIAWPNSFCPLSRTPLKWWENIPVVSYLMLGGKGRISKLPIHWRYPTVEIFTAIVFVAIWMSFSPAVAISYIIMAAMFIAGSFIDAEFKIIPDSLTVGGALVGLVLCVAVPQLHGFAQAGEAWNLLAALKSLGTGLLGLAIGSAIILWMAILGEMALKREAMGFGDVKLLGFIGAMLGWQGAVFAIFGGAFVGMGVALVTLVLEKFSKKDATFFGREMPFGPMLCVAAAAYVWLKPVLAAYGAQLTGGVCGG